MSTCMSKGMCKSFMVSLMGAMASLAAASCRRPLRRMYPVTMSPIIRRTRITRVTVWHTVARQARLCTARTHRPLRQWWLRRNHRVVGHMQVSPRFGWTICCPLPWPRRSARTPDPVGHLADPHNTHQNTMLKLMQTTRLLVSALACVACSAPEIPTVALGRELYTGNGCASCHGPTGHGDGFIAKTMDMPPRDFRNVSAFKNGTDAPAIAESIRRGIGNATQMPAFTHLTEHERLSLALYVIAVHDSTPPIP